MTSYETKDSGVHQEYESGMKRDSQDGKPRFDLIRTKLQPYEEQMITRYAALLARGAAKYSARNWENGNGEEELERAKASLLRHTEQLVAGEADEDHAAAVWFNAQAIEYFRWRIARNEPKTDEEYAERERAERASEVNHLATQKAAQIRRRERLRVNVAEIATETGMDSGPSILQAVADLNEQNRKALELMNRPATTGQLSEDGKTVTFRRPSGWEPELSDPSGAVPITPNGTVPAGSVDVGTFAGETNKLIEAARFPVLSPLAPTAHYTLNPDGSMTNNTTGAVVQLNTKLDPADLLNLQRLMIVTGVGAEPTDGELMADLHPEVEPDWMIFRADPDPVDYPDSYPDENTTQDALQRSLDRDQHSL